MTVEARQKVSGWQTSPQPVIVTQINGSEGSIAFDAKTTGSYSLTLGVAADGTVTVSIN
ncbi:MAG: hypothetical protein K6G66_08340 [Oscillospiraceae bacterium]|nr:hypothetical protein [Oscillospiraceae bacterium]